MCRVNSCDRDGHRETGWGLKRQQLHHSTRNRTALRCDRDLTCECASFYRDLNCDILFSRPYLEANKRELLADYALPVAVLVMTFVGSYLFREVKRESTPPPLPSALRRDLLTGDSNVTGSERCQMNFRRHLLVSSCIAMMASSQSRVGGQWLSQKSLDSVVLVFRCRWKFHIVFRKFTNPIKDNVISSSFWDSMTGCFTAAGCGVNRAITFLIRVSGK